MRSNKRGLRPSLASSYGKRSRNPAAYEREGNDQLPGLGLTSCRLSRLRLLQLWAPGQSWNQQTAPVFKVKPKGGCSNTKGGCSNNGSHDKHVFHLSRALLSGQPLNSQQTLPRLGPDLAKAHMFCCGVRFRKTCVYKYIYIYVKSKHMDTTPKHQIGASCLKAPFQGVLCFRKTQRTTI